MGFRFRKSVNFGIFRVNASKTGLGWSVGVPGARYTKMANGRTRTTASIPGTGISWVEESKKETKTVVSPQENAPKTEELHGWALFWTILWEIFKGLLVLAAIILAVCLIFGLPFVLAALDGAKGK